MTMTNKNEDPIKEIIIESERSMDLFVKNREKIENEGEKNISNVVFLTRRLIKEFAEVYKICTGKDADVEYAFKFVLNEKTSELTDFMNKNILKLEEITDELKEKK